MSNIGLGKNRQSTVTKVSFPTLPSVSLQPVKIDLYEEKHMHDILVLQFATTMPNWFKLLKTGVPVRFQYTQGPFSRTWVGYVSLVSKHVIGQLQEIMEVKCIGSTFGLKERASKVFTNVTITEVVGKIAAEFGFNFVHDPHPVKFPQLTIAGHSYWEWIQEHAKKIGYGMRIEGMTITFKPLDKLIDSGVTSIPTFSMFGKGTGINNMQEDRTLDWFNVLNGEHIEHLESNRTTKKIGGVNPLTGVSHGNLSSPKNVGKATRKNVSDVLFSEIRQDQVASDPQIAKALSEGASHNARMNLPAEIRGQGDPRIRLFHPVMVQGTGELTDGIWVVYKAVHHFTANNNYQVDLRVATDGLGASSSAYLTNATNRVVGMVNLNEALSNNGRNPAATNTTHVALSTKSFAKKELAQGWSRTPAKWIYSRKS